MKLTDIDEYHLINHLGGYEETGTLRGAFPVDDKRTVSVPVTEFQIRLVTQRGCFMAKVGYFKKCGLPQRFFLDKYKYFQLPL